MTRSAEVNAIWAAYVTAVDEHAEAASVVYTHARGSSPPTAAEIQREADTRVIMVGARTAYFDARDRPYASASLARIHERFDNLGPFRA